MTVRRGRNRDRTAAGRSDRPVAPSSRRGLRPATIVVHGGDRPDYNAGAVVPPVYFTSTYRYPRRYSELVGRSKAYLYSREENPTREGPEQLLAELEHAERARLFSSGMGAISAVALSLVEPGDEVVALEDLYGGTLELLRSYLAPRGVGLRWIGPDELAEPDRAFAGRSARLLWLESPTNPTLRVIDLRRWSRAAHAVGALVVVDNTFATPLNQRPLELGADLVVHSGTKYLAGHSDLLCGAVAGPTRLLDRIDPHFTLGAPLDPMSAFLLHRSLKTLALRMARHNENARTVAGWLREQPAVARVFYPGWTEPGDEPLAARQMSGRSGMVSFSLRGGRDAVRRFLKRLELFQVASSLGGVESLVSVPAETSHRRLSREELLRRGIDDGFVRLSVGIEDPADLLDDLSNAIRAAR